MPDSKLHEARTLSAATRETLLSIRSKSCSLSQRPVRFHVRSLDEQSGRGRNGRPQHATTTDRRQMLRRCASLPSLASCCRWSARRRWSATSGRRGQAGRGRGAQRQRAVATAWKKRLAADPTEDGGRARRVLKRSAVQVGVKVLLAKEARGKYLRQETAQSVGWPRPVRTGAACSPPASPFRG